jgi:hypothetical protein
MVSFYLLSRCGHEGRLLFPPYTMISEATANQLLPEAQCWPTWTKPSYTSDHADGASDLHYSHHCRHSSTTAMTTQKGQFLVSRLLSRSGLAGLKGLLPAQHGPQMENQWEKGNAFPLFVKSLGFDSSLESLSDGDPYHTAKVETWFILAGTHSPRSTLSPPNTHTHMSPPPTSAHSNQCLLVFPTRANPAGSEQQVVT